MHQKASVRLRRTICQSPQVRLASLDQRTTMQPKRTLQKCLESALSGCLQCKTNCSECTKTEQTVPSETIRNKELLDWKNHSCKPGSPIFWGYDSWESKDSSFKACKLLHFQTELKFFRTLFIWRYEQTDTCDEWWIIMFLNNYDFSSLKYIDFIIFTLKLKTDLQFYDDLYQTSFYIKTPNLYP